ncbi:MAG: Phosphoesterase family [Phycisphaerales bacterium]|nr:Phosphoesterase family [Phycisphaerales bacterium]
MSSERIDSHVRFHAAAALITLAGFLCVGCESRPTEASPQTVPLATGRALDAQAPPATQPVGSLPVNLAASPDGKFVIVTDAGFKQALWSIGTEDGKGVSHVEFPTSRADHNNGLYYGLVIAPDNTVYAAQGNRDSVAVLALGADGTLEKKRTINTRVSDFPAGLALDGRGYLYVTNNDPTAIASRTPSPAPATHPAANGNEDPEEDVAATGLNASVAIYDAKSGKEVGRVELPGAVPGTSVFPLSVAALRDGHKVYVASERDAGLYLIDATDPAHPKQTGFLATGANPDALLFDKAQARLFVANAHSDTISVIDTSTDHIVSTVLLRPEIAKNLAGATPTGLALSPDEKTLYASLGDMNAVAVVEVEQGEAPALRGYIPAGWYPTAVSVSPDGKRLLVADAKGLEPRIPHDAVNGNLRSPLFLVPGLVTTIPVPTEKELPALTERALAAARLTPADIKQGNPLEKIGLKAGKIQHVIYIIKENRTYDQVLGDVPQGNGDAQRCIFGKDITPNQHALAERFVLFDNFYDSGEVSGDGWVWSTQAQANEYVIRNVPYNYSSRGRSFDFEGQTNDYLTGGFPAKGPDGKPLSEHPAFKNGAKPIPDVAQAPGGHLWDMAKKAGLSYRNYGFFSSGGIKTAGKIVIPDNYPTAVGLQPGGHDLAGVTDLDFRRFDLDYPDSEARQMLAKQTGDNAYYTPKRAYGTHAAPSRFSEWRMEFEQMLAKDASGGAVPAFMTVRLPCDHTSGLSLFKHSPRSMVADNDYGVGQFVEAISKSPIWKSTAIFIIEDDAQNGPDHVDIHRSTCFVISPWIKAHSVDHSFQNTVSVIRTMELLLGLDPMCQYDAAARSILDWTDAPANAEPYAAIMPDIKALKETNMLPRQDAAAADPKLAELIQKSAELDFTRADRAPAELLNQMIWASVRGTASVMPPTPHGPEVGKKAAKDDDDDD